jgi:hypothetical protein
MRGTRGLVLDVAKVIIAKLARNQIVLSPPPDVVARFLKRPQEYGFTCPQHMVHRPVTPNVRIPTGHERTPARGTYRVLAKGVTERHAIRSYDPIQVGRHRRWVAHMAENVTTPLVWVKDHEMRTFFH